MTPCLQDYELPEATFETSGQYVTEILRLPTVQTTKRL